MRVAWVARLGGPALATLAYLALPVGTDGLTPAGRATAAIALLMAVWWMTEALPLPVTALLPVVLFPLLGVASIHEATAPYASDVIFLFLGGFLIALAVRRWHLDRRLALVTILLVGTRPVRLVGGFMLATALLSMWVSNTATAVVMLPIALSVLALVSGSRTDDDGPALDRGLGTALMLAIAYAASIGSLATLIGSPPNLLMKGYLERVHGVELGFARWMTIGVPLAATFLTLTWLILTRVAYRLPGDEIPGGRAAIREELRTLGRVDRGQRVVVTIFVLTASAWILREPLAGWQWAADHVPALARLTDAGIAITAAVALFAVPIDIRRSEFVLRWDDAIDLPWGILLLFGGGLSLASTIQATGVADWIGLQVAGLAVLPTLVLVVAVVAVVVLLTEVTSNTATAAVMLPVLGGVAGGTGLDPLLLVVPAAMAATCAFMMPVATPPNAVVFASGHVTIKQMVRVGWWLNLLGIGLITLATYTLGAWMLGIRVG